MIKGFTLTCLLLTFSFSNQLFSQTTTAKFEIDSLLKIFKGKNLLTYKVKTSDSVFFYFRNSKSSNLTHIEFYELVQNNNERKKGIVYQFYYLNKNLIFVNQGSHNRKYFSYYYINNDTVITSNIHKELVFLPINTILYMSNNLMSKQRKFILKD